MQTLKLNFVIYFKCKMENEISEMVFTFEIGFFLSAYAVYYLILLRI